MGTTSLVGQLLRSLCNDSQWEYAVFWKLKHRSRMFLTWEDGYCDHPKAKSFVECDSENVCFSETAGIASSRCEINAYNGSSDGYPIGLAVANMSCLRYSLGEGFVGRVASMGKHCWVYSDEVYSASLHEYPDEWQLQFAVGIKTILLVPVVLGGVVQLGSLDKVTKDTKVVTHIKDVFNTPQLVPEASMPLTLNRGLQDQSTSSLNSHLLETSTEPSTITSNLQNPIQSRLMVKKDISTLDNIQILKNRLSLINPDIKSQLMGQDNIQVQKKGAGSMRRTEVDALSPRFSAVSFPQNQFSNASHLEKLSNISNFSIRDKASVSAQSSLTNLGFDFDTDTKMNLCFSSDIMDPPFGDEEEILASAQSNLTNLGFDFDTDMNLWFSNDIMDLPFDDEIYMETDYETVLGPLTFPADSELHKALGPAFQKCCNEYVEANIAGEDLCSVSGLIHRNFTGDFEPSVRESSGFCWEGSAKEDLLDAVVARKYTVPGDSASNGSSDVRSPTTASGRLTASCQTEYQSRSDYLVGDDLGQWDNGKPAMPAFVSRQGVAKSSLSESSLKSIITTQVDEIQRKGCGYINSRRGTKLFPIAKRKSRLGDVQKPRPRDRQLIQDHLRELRELIPNSEKCSIDSLLDRTVKHMLFLRSVGNQAEKLKQHANRKVVGRKNQKSSETEGHHNGTSWKFELGRQLGVCPVIVEDLDHPGHVLIEVLCEEHTLFLEIAQILQNLELTILKGVTEQHSDKILAHFIVEVSSGFNKMNIFWPLMHLLQHSNPVPSIF